MLEILTALMIEGSVIKTDKPGLGILGIRINSLTRAINKVHPSGPAARANLQVGDKIIYVDEKDNKLRPGDPGDPVTLTIKRGKEVFELTLIRQDVREFNNKSLSQYFGAY